MGDSVSIGRVIICAGREAAWAPISVLVLHSVGGALFGHEPYVDPAMHFLGGVAAAFFLRHACSLVPVLLGSPSPLALDLLAFGLTCTLALCWEFAEFFADQYFGTQMQRGVPNTMRDLLLGTFGAAFYITGLRVV